MSAQQTLLMLAEAVHKEFDADPTARLRVDCFNFAEAFGLYHLLTPEERLQTFFTWIAFDHPMTMPCPNACVWCSRPLDSLGTADASDPVVVALGRLCARCAERQDAAR